MINKRNKNTKKSFSLVTIMFVGVLAFLFSMGVCFSDSGFDTDYDSGGGGFSSGGYDSGYSGGGYSGSSYSSSNGSSGTSGIFIGDFMFFLFMLIVVIIIYNIVAAKVSSSKNNPTETIYNDNLDKIKEFFPDADVEALKKSLFDSYLKIQNAWSEFDYDTMRELCTDELFNSYKTQLKILKTKGQKNVMEGFNANKIAITNIELQNDELILTVYMSVTFYDYIINAKTNEVMRGSNSKPVTNNYVMTFIKSNKEVKITKCPNCGAPLEDNHSSTCPYCDSDIILPSTKFILSKKTNIKTVK